MIILLAWIALILGVVALAAGRFLYPPQEAQLRTILNHDKPHEKAAIHRQDNMRYTLYLVGFVLIMLAVIFGLPSN
jgi:hypothetical protein